MWTRQSLIEHLDRGNAVDFFFFFWGHTPKEAGVGPRDRIWGAREVERGGALSDD